MSEAPRPNSVPELLIDELRRDVFTDAEVAALRKRLAELPGIDLSPEAGPPGLATSAAAGLAGKVLLGVLLAVGLSAAVVAVVYSGSTGGPQTPVASPRASEAPKPQMLPTSSAPQPVLEPSHVPIPASASLPIPRAQPSSSPEENARAEHELLKEARRALGGSPRRTLQLVREHERRFAGGALTQEREVLAIEALSATGQAAAARARVRNFAKIWPRSFYLERFSHLLGRSGPTDAG